MPVTRSKSAERAQTRRSRGNSAFWRRGEFLWLVLAGAFVGIGLHLVYQAKTRPLAEVSAGLANKTLLNLNSLGAREDLLPALSMFPDPAEREFVARKIYYLSGGLANVGAIARIRVTADEVSRGRGLKGFRDRLAGRDSMPLFSSEQIRALKPLFVVRQPGAFERVYYRWVAFFFAAYLLAHAWWCMRGFRGDQTFLPALLLLTGRWADSHDRPARPRPRQPAFRRFCAGRGRAARLRWSWRANSISSVSSAS